MTFTTRLHAAGPTLKRNSFRSRSRRNGHYVSHRKFNDLMACANRKRLVRFSGCITPPSAVLTDRWPTLFAPIGRAIVRLRRGTRCSIIRGSPHTFRVGSIPVQAVPSSIIEPIWTQFAALLPSREVAHSKKVSVASLITYNAKRSAAS